MKHNKLVILKDNRVNGTDMEYNFIPNLNEHNINITNLAVFHTHIDHYLTKKYTGEVLENFSDDTLYCYSLEPFGGLGNFLGVSEGYDESFFSKIKSEIKSLINDKDNFYLLIIWPHEATMGQSELSLLHKKIKESDIKLNKVIFVMNRNWSLEKDYDIIINNELKIPDFEHMSNDNRIKFVNFDYFLVEKGEEAIKDNFYTDKSFLTEKREKNFICLNRRLMFRWHRMFVLMLTNKYNLFEKNLFSYDLLFEGKSEEMIWNHTPRKMLEYYDLKSLRESWEDLYKNNPQSFLDFKNFHNITGFRTEAEEFYKKTYFSLVTETMFFEGVDFATEKIFKPICHYHGFLVLGRPHTLKRLKEFGFKTFGEFWDESYDEELDNANRFKKVYDIFLKINSMSKDEVHNLYLKMIPILEHNYNLITSIGKNKLNWYKELENKVLSKSNDK